MKIAFISLTDVHSSTGKGMLYLARELIKKGYQIDFITFAWQAGKGSLRVRDSTLFGVKIKNIYAGKGPLSILIRGTMGLITKLKADYYILVKPLPIHSIPFLIARLFKKKKTILYYDDWEGIGCSGSFSEIPFFQRILTTFIEEYVPRHIDGVIATSKILTKRIKDMGVNNVAYVQYASSTKEFSFEAESRRLIRGKCNINPDETVFIYMGSHNSPMVIEGLKLFLDSMSNIDKNFKLIITGKGKRTKEIEEVVEKDKLGKKVIFTGYLANNDLPRYLSAADIAIIPYPSYYPYTMRVMTCNSRKLFDYMAAGLPVIVNDMGEFKHIIRDQRTRVNTENKEEFIRRISSLLELPKEELKKIGEENRKRIDTEFDYSFQAQKVDSFLKSI